jgi:replicative DNA helicase
LQRAVTNLSQLDAAKWFQPNVRFSESEKGEVINNLGIFSQLNINVYDDASISCQQIILNTRKRRKELGGTNNLVVMIDYLQLMEGGAAETNTLRIGKITRDLKKLAMECDVPIILLSQLSRGVESRQDKRPIQSDLRDSGNIEQDADVILFLHRDDYYNRDGEDQDNITEVIVAKARDGSTGSVKFLFVKEYMKFTELTYQEQV